VPGVTNERDLIYVDKNNDSNFINDWKYYRVTPIAQSNIEVCEVEFPSLRDKVLRPKLPVSWDSPPPMR
jgi:hypothetical protein